MKRLLLSILIASVQIAFGQTTKPPAQTPSVPVPPTKLSPDLPTASPWQIVEVIVQFKTNGNNFAAFSANVNLAAKNGQVMTQLPKINAVHMKLPMFAVQILQALPQVKYVSVNRPLKRMLDITTQAVN